MKLNKLIFIIDLLIIGLLSIYALSISSIYKYLFLLYIPVLIIFYSLQKKIKLDAFKFLLISLFLISANLGVFGLYGTGFFGLVKYDGYLHFLFGFLAFYIIFDLFKGGKTKRFILALLAVLLLGIVHEFWEYVLSFYFGIQGVLLAGGGFDLTESIRDVKNNLFGALVGFILILLRNMIFKSKNE